ncbi:MAG: TIGR01244 family sulfur transferase [Pseudomonadota bacterium]
MDIRPITDSFAVAPQIYPDDFVLLADAGFTTIICNRPDSEVPQDLGSDAMRAAAEASGLTFVFNPVSGPALAETSVDIQGDAVVSSKGPVLAYCASGTRSAAVWALSQAGRAETETLLTALRQAGYALDGLRPQLEVLAARVT